MAKDLQAARDQALLICSMFDEPFPLELIRVLLGSEDGILQLLDEEILEETDRPGWLVLRGCPATAHSAGQLTRVERRDLWRRIAEKALELRLDDPVVADYLVRAGRIGEARKCWIRAAEKACTANDYAQARLSLQHALAIWPWSEDPAERVRILREQARCASNAGDSAAAAEAWRQLAEYSADNEEHSLRVEALGQLARHAGDAAMVASLLKEAAELAERKLEPPLAVRRLLEYVDHLSSRVRISMAEAVLQRAAILAEPSGHADILSELRGWQGLLAAMSGRHQEAASRVEDSLQIAIAHELPEQVALAYRRRANIADYCSDYSREISAHREAIQYCRQSGAGDQLTCLSCMAYACYRSGDWKGCLQAAQAVLDNPDSQPSLRGFALCLEGMVASFRGERQTAAGKLDAAIKRLRLDGLPGIEFFALMGMANLRIIDGDKESATQLYDEVRALWQETEDLHDVIPAVLFAAVHYAQEGFPERVSACIDVLMTISRKNPVGEAFAALAAVRGCRNLVEGDRAGFVQAMEESSRLYSGCGLPLEQAWTGLNAVAHGGEASQAGSMAVARRLGLRPLLALVESASDRKSRLPCDLPPRLREILGLLASGLTSKEMASELGISTRTVEMHVGRLLKRLNCRTRSEAVHLAGEKGWL